MTESNKQPDVMTPDRQEVIWRAVRRALLMVVKAIEECYPNIKSGR